jgi:hypothetical protein
MRRRSFQPEALASLRLMHVCDVLDRLHLHWKRDPDFRPRGDPRTMRVHVSLDGGRVIELLAVGVKWYDPQAQRGGGGAIDLVMHLLNIGFVDAVQLLQPQCKCQCDERTFDATPRNFR